VTSLLDTVATYLTDRTLVGGATGWTLAKGWMPPTPDKIVGLFEYAGSPPDNRPHLDRPGLQVRVRGDKHDVADAYAVARRHVQAIRGALHTQCVPGLIGIAAVQSAFPLGLDDSQRIEFVCNFECWIDRN